ncbi:MAG: ATP-binding protein [Planctomycetota bacterium]
MRDIPRLYQSMLTKHFAEHRQMAFVSGARQVGKTTTCRAFATSTASYFNWDNQDDRRILLRGPQEIAQRLQLDKLAAEPPTIIFDELHKYSKWKSLLKGFFDTYSRQLRIVVTGSSRLDVYRRGGDSMMGRYLLYRMHPFSIAELGPKRVVDAELTPPSKPTVDTWNALWTYGGFPEPFVRRDARFFRRWRDLRLQQLVREDIRDLTRIQELSQIESLVRILAEQSASTFVLSSLAREINTSVDTLRRWSQTLCAMHYGFLVRPWHKSVAKTLRKEPKWYLTDWSSIADPGQRAETFIACHLLKAVEGWQDLGLGNYELRYLRDKEKREVDFLVVRDRKPWFLVEAKLAERDLSPALRHFQQQIGAPHAFQAVVQMDYVGADCFERTDPCVVPAQTLLSQLL